MRPEEIRAQKLSVCRLAEVAESQTESFEFLAESESDALAFHEARRQRCTVGRHRSFDETTRGSPRKAATDLRKDYEVHQQRRMTRRLNVLTVITAIFIPLMLLAGIGG